MKRVQIIEDESVVAEIFRNKFTRRGFLVELAADGRSGLEKIAQFKPDLLVLDIMLPQLSGLDLMRTIRGNPASATLPIIVYSNSFSKQDTDQARALGALHVLNKSETSSQKLIELVAEALEVRLDAAASDAPANATDRARCIDAALHINAAMRPFLKEFFARNDMAALASLHAQTHMFGIAAWIAGLPRIAHLSDALETLLTTLVQNPRYISFSTDKTVLQAVDCLERMMQNPAAAEKPPSTPAILVVDDQEIPLQATVAGLNKAGLPAQCEMDAQKACLLIEQHRFDLVLLDINMPAINGMELCAHMRTLTHHKHTPVIFFSQLSQVEHRIESTVVGGSDFIGKPFLTIELAVKALVWLATPLPKEP